MSWIRSTVSRFIRFYVKGEDPPTEYYGATCSSCRKSLPPLKEWKDHRLQKFTSEPTMTSKVVHVFHNGAYFRIEGEDEDNILTYYCKKCFEQVMRLKRMSLHSESEDDHIEKRPREDIDSLPPSINQTRERKRPLTDSDTELCPEKKRPKYCQGAKPELSDLLKELQGKVSDRWEDIGIHLGVDVGALKIIKARDRQATDCLREMFISWEKRAEPKPTWKAIFKALENIRENKLAQSLEENSY